MAQGCTVALQMCTVAPVWRICAWTPILLILVSSLLVLLWNCDYLLYNYIIYQHCVVNPPMPKEGVKTAPSYGLLWVIFSPVLIPQTSFAYLFLSIKGIFWHTTHYSTLDRSCLSGPGTYRIIPTEGPRIVVWLCWFCSKFVFVKNQLQTTPTPGLGPA